MNEQNLLSSDGARVLAYFAVGVGSEGSVGGRDVSNHLSFAGKENGGTRLEPVGNSGYSLGTLQTDLGAHPEVAQPLVAAYQAWAQAHQPKWVLDEPQQRQTITDLGRNGNAIRDEDGRPLNQDVKSQLDAFLQSDAGKTFVHERDERQVNQLTRPDGVWAKLQATPLYQSASKEDQARLATIALKVENQTGGEGAVWKHEKHKKPYQVVEGLVESINKGEIKGMDDVTHWVDKHPGYVRDGVAHALQGTETFLRLEGADPKSDLHRAWQSVKANATVNPGTLDPNSALGKDYAAVKDQFLHPHGHRQRQHGAQGHESTLRQGMHNDAVQKLQTQLGELGYLDNAHTPDGKFGPATHRAVKAFQHDHQLAGDGRAGPTTQQKIQADLLPLRQDGPGASATVSGTDLGLADPRHASNANHALFASLKARFPDASDNRLLQFTAVCHASGITDKNLTDVRFDQQKGVVAFAGWQEGQVLRHMAAVDVKQPSPQPQQSIQQIQQFDHQQAQSLAAAQARGTQAPQPAPAY
jgi:hypothetical protein